MVEMRGLVSPSAAALSEARARPASAIPSAACRTGASRARTAILLAVRVHDGVNQQISKGTLLLSASSF
jgi:hypothetical protein